MQALACFYVPRCKKMEVEIKNESKRERNAFLTSSSQVASFELIAFQVK